MTSFIKREYDYAIRIMAYLAGKTGQGPIPVSRLSRTLFLSKNFINKIIFQLRQAGLIESVQGKYGGLSLHGKPEDISIFDILSAMGFQESLNECTKNHDICPLSGFCLIHTFFKEQEDILFGQFRNKKLSELIIRDQDLKTINKELPGGSLWMP